MKYSTYRICVLGIMGALAIVLALVVRFPIFPQVAFLEYDMGDVPIFLSTYMFGPWWGLLLTAIVCGIQGVTVSAASGIYGIIMHFIATGTYVLVSGLIYSKHRTIKGAIIALISGSLAWVLVMIPANLIITPFFMEVSVEVVLNLLLWIVLFNLIKAVGNSLITFLLYKRMRFLFKKLFRVEDKETQEAIVADTDNQTSVEQAEPETASDDKQEEIVNDTEKQDV